MKEIAGHICAPKGFTANGIHCGIRKNKDRKDLALIVSERPCSAAAMYTTNKVQAASIHLTRKHLADGKLQAIICNSGNANACTGEAGLNAAAKMAQLAADALHIAPELVAVGSTGVIGVPLPTEPVASGMASLFAGLGSSEAHADAALAAIMTTDVKEKKIAVAFTIDGIEVKLGGIAKGAGMIHPNMATMLSFITCDAAVESAALQKALQQAVRRSYNRVTVDGDTSTNDCVIVMANGMAGNQPLHEGSPDWKAFTQALEYVCVYLARAIAADGEGATRLVTCAVEGAADEATAEVLAKAVVGSSLVKAACFGADANWGRILCAMGYSGADFVPETVDVRFKSAVGELEVCKSGASVPFSEEIAKKVLSESEIEILIQLRSGTGLCGQGAATAWGCDLTYEYVKINGDYRS